jgi:hypothetical protein
VPNTAEPATSTLAPAAAIAPALSSLTPPSTSIATSRPAVVEVAPQGRDLVEDRRDEALAAEAGVDAHEQHHRDVAQHPADGLERGRRVEDDHRLLAELADRRDGAVQVRAGLDVDADQIGAGAGVLADPAIGAARSSGGRRGAAW